MRELFIKGWIIKPVTLKTETQRFGKVLRGKQAPTIGFYRQLGMPGADVKKEVPMVRGLLFVQMIKGKLKKDTN